MNIKDIEVGMYVRTKTQGIKRIDTIFEDRPVNRYGFKTGGDWDGTEYEVIKTNDIVKASHNIMDIIETGDYVNGCKVLGVKIAEDMLFLDSKEDGGDWIFSSEIKTIVTKEYFEEGKFEV